MSNETPDPVNDERTSESRMHELLCAYVLGEANADERVEVERALAESEPLRLEKAQIERTIGFVQTALVGDDVLSPAAREEVLRAAMPTPVIPMWRRTWVRAAASVLFVSFALGGWAIYHGRTTSLERELPVDREVARRPVGEKRSAGDRRELVDSTSNVRDADELQHTGYDAGAAAKDQTPGLTSSTAGAAGYRGAGDSVPASAAAPAAGAVAATPPKETDSNAPDAPGGAESKQASSDSQAQFGFLAKKTASDDKVIDNLFHVDTAVRQEPAVQVQAPPPVLLKSKSEELSFGGGGGGGGGAGPSTPAPSGPSTGGPSSSWPSPSTSTRLQGALRARAPADRLGRMSEPGRGKRSENAPGRALDGLGYTSDSATTAGAQPSKGAAVGAVVDALEEEDALLGERSKSKSRSGDEDLRRSQHELSDEDQFIANKLRASSGLSGAPEITPELRARYRDEYVDDWCRRVVRHCQPRPDERPRDMFFRYWGDNPFEFAALDALSTFSADVDTASYTLARRYIDEGHIPEKAQVRTEEFVNAFPSDVPAPEHGTFAIRSTLAPSRFGAPNPGEIVTFARDMLRVVIRAKDVPKAERKPMALTLVVDVSGSMKEQNRIEMVKHAMRLLVSQLDARDSIAIVKFSTDAALVLPMTSAKQKDLIESAIYPLTAEGSTNSEAGLRMGYAAALAGMNVEGTNRVVFLSDGVANVGVTDSKQISDEVKTIREKGIYLNTIGVGMNNHNDELLEQLADKGDGVCNYVDSPAEAKKVFVDQFMGTLETVARDVKLQVEFDPSQVYRYRLLGYENRAIADADFRNDKVDAGEVGAGHQVTALYEIEYAHRIDDEMKLGAPVGGPRPIATVRVRYKAPRNLNAPTANEEATEIEQTVMAAQRSSWEGAGPNYRRSVLAAQFAEFLRRSVHARSDSFDLMISDAKRLETEAPDKDTSELVTLMEKSKALILDGWPNRDELAQAVDMIRENCLRRAELERVATERDRELLATIEEQNRKLEERLRETMRRRLEQQK